MSWQTSVREATFSDFQRATGVAPMAIMLVAGAGLLVYWLGIEVAGGKYQNLVAVAVLVQSLWILMNWRMGVYAFMVYVVVEGFLINYFPGTPELNLIKDVLAILLFVVLMIFLRGKLNFLPNLRVPWMVFFIAFSVIYVAQVFNPSLPNLVVGAVGVRATLLFFLLTPVGFWFFESAERVRQFFVFMSFLCVPVALFGIFQYVVGPQWMVSLSPGFGRAVFYAYGAQSSQEDAYFRTFSTFVHTGGFAQFLFFMMLVSLGMWAVPRMQRHRVWIALAFGLQFFALLTTGNRGAFVWFVLGAFMMLLMLRGSVRVVPLLVVAPLLLWGTLFIVGPGFADRFETLLDMDYVARRNKGLLYGWLAESMKTDWAGLGAGYASVAARHAGATPLNAAAVENGLAKIRFETGMPGFVAYVLFIGVLLLDVLRTPLRVRDPVVRPFAAACATFLFLNLASVAMGTPFDSSPSNVYIWFFLGFLMRCALLPASAEQQATAGAPAVTDAPAFQQT